MGGTELRRERRGRLPQSLGSVVRSGEKRVLGFTGCGGATPPGSFEGNPVGRMRIRAGRLPSLNNGWIDRQGIVRIFFFAALRVRGGEVLIGQRGEHVTSKRPRSSVLGRGLCVMLAVAACGDARNEGEFGWLSRLVWGDDETSVEIIQGVTAFDVVLRDDEQKFIAFGNDGSNARTEDGGETWTGLTDIGSANLYGANAWETRSVVVGAGGTLGVRDSAGSSSFACSSVGGSGTVNQTGWHTPCVKPGGTPALYEVARFETSRWVAVGAGGKAWRSGPADHDDYVYDPDVVMEQWVDISPPSTLFSEAWHNNSAPDLWDVARVADGVVAVGDEGTVVARAAGASEWKLLDLGSATHGWGLKGVAVDDVNQFVEKVGASFIERRVAGIVVVGDDGVSARFEIDWNDFSSTFLANSIVLYTSNVVWGTADLRNVTVDERSRIVVGRDNTVFALPHEAEWDDTTSWMDLEPPGNVTEHYADVASDGTHIVVVGQRVGSPSIGVSWPATESVRECYVGVDVEYLDDSDLDTDYDHVDIDVDLAAMKPAADCAPMLWAYVDDPVRVNAMLAFGDPERNRLTDDENPTLVGSTLSFTTELTDVVGSPTSIAEVFPVSWRANLVEDDGTDLTHYRVTMVRSDFYPFAELQGWRRDGMFPRTGTTPYPLDEIPWPDFQSSPDPVFVDLVFGVQADESDNEFVDSQGIVLDEAADMCGSADEKDWAYTPSGCSLSDLTLCETPLTVRNPDDSAPNNDVIDFFSGVSRFRAASGHPFVDFAESLDEGMAWRSHSMKHYLFTRCDLVEFEDGSGGVCTQLEPGCPAATIDADWEAQCCTEDLDPEDGYRLPLVDRVPLYAPFNGTAFRIASYEEDRKPDRVQGQSGVADDCAMVDSEGEWREYPDYAAKLVEMILLVSENGDMVLRLDHVESCLFDPAALPTLIDPAENVGVEVEAGDRIAEAINAKQTDVVVYIRDERDAWRATSYFDLVPNGIYNLYKQQFDFGDRNTDPGENGFGDADDPIISLEDRDECPLAPKERDDAGLHMWDRDEVLLRVNPVSSDSFCEENGADNVIPADIFVR